MPDVPPRYNPVLILLVLAALAGGLYFVVSREGTSQTASAPLAPPSSGIARCFVADLALDPSGKSGAVYFSSVDKDFDVLLRDGTLKLHVEYTGPRDPKNTGGVAEAAASACEASGRVSAAGHDAGFTVAVTFDAPCPSVPPEGKIVTVGANFNEDGDASTGGYCEYSGKVPVALGGQGLSAEEQSAAALAGSAARDKPAEYATVHGYVDRLAHGALAIDPSTMPKLASCPPDAKGSVVAMPYETLVKIVAPVRAADAGALPEPLALLSGTAYLQYVTTSASAALLAGSYATADGVTALAPRLAAANRYVVVLTTQSAITPTVAIPERQSGQTVVEARLMPGSYHGGMFVLDLDVGKVVCNAPVAAASSNSRMETSNPNDMSAGVRADLAIQAEKDWTATLARIAPGLTLEVR
ncbi:hypothetical protein BH09MYX1_BH09MYX1_33860 [soil metagenome]